jgi:enediyne polyketide synthase
MARGVQLDLIARRRRHGDLRGRQRLPERPRRAPARGGWRAAAFNWPAWSGAGAAARDAALLEKMAAEARFSIISPDEGRALLRDELARGIPSATVFLIGEPEAGFLAPRLVSPWPLLDEVTRIDRDTLVARRTFSVARDPWLAEHRVDGDPVVPGTFELEMAAEAACALDGARAVRAFEDIRFDLFVKLFGDRPTVVEVRAQRRPDGASRPSSPPTCTTAGAAPW